MRFKVCMEVLILVEGSSIEARSSIQQVFPVLVLCACLHGHVYDDLE